jgi:THO complex subunit 4
MSTGKLDQSLDEILKTRRTSDRRGRGARRGAGRPAASAAPIGGVAKSTRQPKQPKNVPTAPAAAASGESKIMISNLVCLDSKPLLHVLR